MFKTIRVTLDIWKELRIISTEKELQQFNDVIKYLLKLYKKAQKTNKKEQLLNI
jgi:predicted CopG family antitoxin